MSNLLDYILIVTIVFSNIFLALLVLTKNRKDTKNIFFFQLALSIALWNLVAFFADFILDNQIRLLLSRGAYLLSFLALYFAVCFTYFFIKTKVHWLITFLNTLICLFVTTLIISSDKIINSITPTATNFTINTGGFSFVLWIAVVTYILQIIYIPLKNYRKETMLKKNQIKFVFFGFVTFSLSVFIFNFVVKNITGSDAYYRYGNYSALFVIAFTSYALIKHRLMDIRMVVARSVAYTILIATMAGFYAGAVVGVETIFYPDALGHFNWAVGIVRTILAVIMAFSFQPLRKWITKVTDKIFFKKPIRCK